MTKSGTRRQAKLERCRLPPILYHDSGGLRLQLYCWKIPENTGTYRKIPENTGQLFVIQPSEGLTKRRFSERNPPLAYPPSQLEPPRFLQRQ